MHDFVAKNYAHNVHGHWLQKYSNLDEILLIPAPNL